MGVLVPQDVASRASGLSRAAGTSGKGGGDCLRGVGDVNYGECGTERCPRPPWGMGVAKKAWQMQGDLEGGNKNLVKLRGTCKGKAREGALPIGRQPNGKATTHLHKKSPKDAKFPQRPSNR